MFEYSNCPIARAIKKSRADHQKCPAQQPPFYSNLVTGNASSYNTFQLLEPFIGACQKLHEQSKSAIYLTAGQQSRVHSYWTDFCFLAKKKNCQRLGTTIANNIFESGQHFSRSSKLQRRRSRGLQTRYKCHK